MFTDWSARRGSSAIASCVYAGIAAALAAVSFTGMSED